MSDMVGQTGWPVRLDYSCPPTLLVCFFGLPCVAARTCGNTEHRGVADMPAHVHVHVHVATGSSHAHAHAHAPDSGDRVHVRAKRIKRFTAARRIPETSTSERAWTGGHVELAECSPGRGSIPGARRPSHAAKHTSCQVLTAPARPDKAGSWRVCRWTAPSLQSGKSLFLVSRMQVK